MSELLQPTTLPLTDFLRTYFGPEGGTIWLAEQNRLGLRVIIPKGSHIIHHQIGDEEFLDEDQSVIISHAEHPPGAFYSEASRRIVLYYGKTPTCYDTCTMYVDSRENKPLLHERLDK